jgi:hypothetical protein
MVRMELYVGVRELNCNQRRGCVSFEKRTAPIERRSRISGAGASSGGTLTNSIVATSGININRFGGGYV